VAKKWKGKDWYAILAPKMFHEIQVAETPATDPAQIIGRTVEVSAAELVAENPKPHMKVYFEVTSVDGKRAFTRFSGFELSNDYIFRMTRKRTSKLMIHHYVETKDKWRLQVTLITVLNRKAEAEIKTGFRKYAEKFLSDFAGQTSIDDFLRAVIDEAVQQHLKKYGSKIYPVRFNEVSKIEVVKAGS